MTVMLGQNCGTPCDPCCACGAFCSNAYCGRDLEFNVTLSGGSDADPMVCSICDTLTGAMGTDSSGHGSYDAATWNSTYKPSWASQSAKSGTTVCQWTSGDSFGITCGVTPTLSDLKVFVYYGADDKWYLMVQVTYEEAPGPSYSADLGGDQMFSGSGAAMDCGSVGEGSPTFSLTVSLNRYNESGAAACYPPVTALVEGNPQ